MRDRFDCEDTPIPELRAKDACRAAADALLRLNEEYRQLRQDVEKQNAEIARLKARIERLKKTRSQ